MFDWIANLFGEFMDLLVAGLVFIYQNMTFGSLGLAIIILTIFIRFVLLPFFYKSARSQALMQKLRPKIDKIRDKYEDNKEKQAEKLMKLYRKYNFNPFSGFLVLIIQLPVFFALFRVFQDEELMTSTFQNTVFLGVNLMEASIVLTLGAAILQYFQGKLSMANKSSGGDGPMASFGKIMPYAGPVISFVILMNLPSALALYWGTSTLFSVGQQYVINQKIEEEDFDENIEEEEEEKRDSEEKKPDKEES